MLANFVRMFFAKHYEDNMILSPENLTLKNTIASTVEALAADDLADEVRSMEVSALVHETKSFQIFPTISK